MMLAPRMKRRSRVATIIGGEKLGGLNAYVMNGFGSRGGSRFNILEDESVDVGPNKKVGKLESNK